MEKVSEYSVFMHYASIMMIMCLLCSEMRREWTELLEGELSPPFEGKQLRIMMEELMRVTLYSVQLLYHL
jgi:NADH:ubiquinone oxidoreductase subunit D